MGNVGNKAFKKEKSHRQASAAEAKKKVQGPKKAAKKTTRKK